MPRWIKIAAAALVLGAPAAAQDLGAGMPRAASDWLAGKAALPKAPASAWRPADGKPADAQRRRSARPPIRRPGQTFADRWPVATSAAVPQVGVSRLAESNPDTRGALTAEAAGLARDLWGPASAADLSTAIAATQPRLQAGRALLVRMLTAQLAPPTGSAMGEEGRLFLARVDRLIALGLVDDARALLQSAGAVSADVFSRSFDLAMYAGDPAGVCAQMAQRPGLSPDLAARVYCLARAGDWSAAALTLRGSHDQGLIGPQTLALLERFLDDGSTDAGDRLPDPRSVTPLEFRLFEAIGQPLATSDLPVAFAHADLTPDAGWKAQIEAAERLARAGGIDPSRLSEVYSQQKPAASGGVWDRAALYQRLDQALADGGVAGLAAALTAAEPAFAKAGLLTVLARLVAPRLPASGLDGPAMESAAHMRLLARIAVPSSAGLPDADRALIALAQGAALPGGQAERQRDTAAASGIVPPQAPPPQEGADAADVMPSPAGNQTATTSAAAVAPGAPVLGPAAPAAAASGEPAAAVSAIPPSAEATGAPAPTGVSTRAAPPASATPAAASPSPAPSTLPAAASPAPVPALPDAAGGPAAPVPVPSDAAAFPVGSPGAAFAEALSTAPLPQAPPEGRGLALLRAIADADAGLDGDVRRAAAGLRSLVQLGQPDTARQAAVELLLTDHLGLRR